MQRDLSGIEGSPVTPNVGSSREGELALDEQVSSVIARVHQASSARGVKAFAILISIGAWAAMTGLYWFALVHLETAGTDGVWLLSAAYATVIILSVGVFLAVLLPGLRRRESRLVALLEAEHEVIGRLRELRQTRADILTQIAHEVRTPITVVNGAIQTMAASDLTPEQRQRLLDSIARGTERLTVLPDLVERIFEVDDPDRLRELAVSTRPSTTRSSRVAERPTPATGWAAGQQ